MMDVASAAIEASSILVTVIKHIKLAVDRQSNLENTLNEYRSTLEQTNSIVTLIQEDNSLQTAGCAAILTRIQEHGNLLKDHLLTMSKPRGKARGILHEIVQGSDEHNKLDTIMGKLQIAKQDVSLQIQFAQVGLVKGVDEAIKINTRTVEKTNKTLQQVLGEGQGLFIARFLSRLDHQRRQEDGMVYITAEEYDKLILELCQPDDSASPDLVSEKSRMRFICNNLTLDQAFQVCGPTGEDIWEEMTVVKIEGNVARGRSVQIAYPLSEQNFNSALDKWEKSLHAPAPSVA